MAQGESPKKPGEKKNSGTFKALGLTYIISTHILLAEASKIVKLSVTRACQYNPFQKGDLKRHTVKVLYIQIYYRVEMKIWLQ